MFTTHQLLCFFCPIFTSALFSISHAGTVEHTTDDMISYSRQVPDSATANSNSAVFLKVVVDARYVSCNFFAVGQSDTCDFS
jgi:hypothetical protein